MPALIVIYAILGWFIFRAKTAQGRKVSAITMTVLSLFFIGLALIGPNPGIVQG